METELIKKIKDNYGLEIINVQVLSGGWMNKKYDDYKDSIDNFYKKIKSVILEDDESVFRIFGSIIDTLYVERLQEENNIQKVMLHFKLNILSHNDSDLNLNDFLLLFNNSDRNVRSNGCYL